MRIVGVPVRVVICGFFVSVAADAQDLGEALVVTATRTPEANAPSNVTVIEGAAIRGVVEIVSRAIVDRAEMELQGGSFGTGEAALSLGKRGDTLAASLDLEGLGTAGYQVIASPGLVDHDASSRRASGRARLEARLAAEFTAFARVGGLGEWEAGGTRYITASARGAGRVA